MLEKVPSSEWERREQYWIAKYANEKLCNHTLGGDGLHNPDEETRARISKAAKEKWEDPVKREALLKAIQDPVRCKKISDKLKGRKKSAEHIAKLPQNQKGFKPNITTKRKEQLVNQMKGNKYMVGRVLSDETKELISDKLKGNTHTLGRKMPENEKVHKSRMQTGITKSDEHKEKIANAMKKVWKNGRVSIKWPPYGYLIEKLHNTTVRELAEELGVKTGTLASKLNREKKRRSA